ncbi:ion transporter [Pseudophaeobacter leonis]|uniref:ion transporter n=1 Tax=Pseudophaeobacter leonis TaxID=1144477 RepID=UPI00111C375E|nr:ion transporter [Pseudophaeobacter leonis]
MMNQIVLGSLLLLGLELVLDSFALQFAALNLIILGFFIFEFCVRLNFRRFRYLRTWGLVDFPVILLETLLLWQVFLVYFALPPSAVVSLTGAGFDHALLQKPAEAYPDWLEQLALWKGLRLLRLLRVFKLARDVARRQKVWARRISAVAAYFRAFLEALVIMAGVLLVMVIFTKFATDQDPQELLRTLSRNVIARLRADQDTGVENSEVLNAIYQVAAVLAGMIIITFFTQLLLPIARRIQATKDEEKQERGKTDHVVIAVADDDAVGLVEEALEVWGVNVGREVVLLVPDGTDLDDPIHPKCTPDIIRGSVHSRGSWLAVDASGASQILILSTDEIDPASLSVFLPRFEEHGVGKSVVILSRRSSEGYRSTTDSSGVRFACLSLESLVDAIEANVTDVSSIQYRFVKQINEKLAADSSIFSATAQETIVQAERIAKKTKAHLKKSLGAAKINCRAQNGIVLIELENDPSEMEEGALIASLQSYLVSEGTFTQTYVFVDALHLVGLNSQIDDALSLFIVPIELLVMYAVYHETICPHIAKGWLLPPMALEDLTDVQKVPSPFPRVTYRNRSELRSAMLDEYPEIVILGLMSTNNAGDFKGYLTDKLDTRKIFKEDLIVAVL